MVIYRIPRDDSVFSCSDAILELQNDCKTSVAKFQDISRHIYSSTLYNALLQRGALESNCPESACMQCFQDRQQQ